MKIYFLAMKLPKPFATHPKINRKANAEKSMAINASSSLHLFDPSPSSTSHSARSSRHSGLEGIFDIAVSLTNTTLPSPNNANQSINASFDGDALGDVLGSTMTKNADFVDNFRFDSLARDLHERQ
jgi:hypothetical protein